MADSFSVRGETKIFDPRDPATGTSGAEVLDATVIQRGDRWWMFLAGQANGQRITDLYSASLPAGSPLTASGWRLTRNVDGDLETLAPRNVSAAWDGKGGRHCPSYVRGWDPTANRWVERIYYAGAAENLWGPYTIGILEWDGSQWVDQPEPAFVAAEDWEHGSVYEPNLIYHDGKWKMWYVAGSNYEDYLVQGYSESVDGRSGWSTHTIFAPAEMKMFDFCVRPRGESFDAVFARVRVGGGGPSAETGLWWCRAPHPSGVLSDWSRTVQIANADDCGWHSGAWKPSLQFDTQNPEHAFIFFDGAYKTDDPGPFPFVFTLGCLELELQHHQVAI